MKRPRLIYRPEINGLRAIAVLSVVLYHARIAFRDFRPFQGGFIGVDIFFVISGYLVSRIVFAELLQNGFVNTRQFYERRARRILPALYVVIGCTMPCALIALFPSELVEYAQSIVATLFFVPHFYFYERGIEYGATESLLRPLLHTWSLGIEFQFYLLFPPIAIFVWTYFRRWFLRLLIGASLVSWCVAIVTENIDPDLAFYSLGSRIWELALGALMAYRELGSNFVPHRYVQRILPTLGLLGIGWSIWAFDGSWTSPMRAMMLPVIGACLIIAFSSRDELAGKILAWKPLVGIGLISYSVYLWHFPLFAMARLYGEPGIEAKGLLIVLITLLATLTFFLVERPSRKAYAAKPRVFLGGCLIIVLMLMGGSLLLIHREGMSAHFLLSSPWLSGFDLDNRRLRQASWKRVRNRLDSVQGFAEVPTRVLIVGNSHAKDTFNVLVSNHSSFAGIDFLPSQASHDFQLACFDEDVPEFLAIREKFYTSRAFEEATTILVSTDWRSRNHCQERRQNWPLSSDFVGVEFLIDRSRASGKKVVLMGQSPHFNWGQAQRLQTMADVVISELEKSGRLNQLEPRAIKDIVDKGLFKALVWERSRSVWKHLSRISDLYAVPLYDKFPLICSTEQKRCDGLTEFGAKTFFDGSHYTNEGAKLFGERLAGDPNFVMLLQ